MNNRISFGSIVVIVIVLFLLYASCNVSSRTYSTSSSYLGKRAHHPTAMYQPATPKPTAASKTTRRPKATSKPEDDPYNASDYAHADDFYYDHRDDFIDFEEAEDYYDAHS